MASSLRTVGQPLLRVEGRDKVLGRTRFTADRPGVSLAHAALVQSTIAHGSLDLAALDAASQRAADCAGVLDILTPANCPQLQQLPSELTDDLPSERRPPLSDLTIQHAGQHLALIVAETPEQATFAATAFAVEQRSEPAVLSFSEALRIAPDEQGRIRQGTYRPDHFTRLKAEKLQYNRGKREPAADFVYLAETYTTPVVHHNPIESSATIASWQGDRLTLRDTTRWIMGSRKTIATYLHMPEENVRVICPYVGGAFGSKAFLWQHVVLAAIAAHRLARPVKLVLTRAQMFTSVGHRPATIQQLSLAADAHGKLTSIEHHTLSATSTVGQFTEPTGLTSRNLYSSPHVAITHTVARLHRPTPCFMRAPGESSGVFALESAIDELAFALGLDPLELRLRNYAPHDQDGGKPWSSKHLRQCYAEAAERFGWAERSPTPRSMRRKGRQVGWGMATATYPGRRMSAGCRVSLGADGVGTFVSASHELGTGLRTVMAQIAADASGLAIEQVRFLSGDSTYPEAPYSGASQTSATVGSAVHEAGLLLKSRILALASEDAAGPLHGIPAQQISLGGGWLSYAESKESVGALLTRHQGCLSFEAKATPPNLEKFGFQSFGAHFCEVEVDEAIGEARVTRWTGTFDGGTVLNPKFARSQIIGGVTFGIGMALLEQTQYDPGTAGHINANLAEYHLPTAADVPGVFDLTFTDHPDLHLNALGVRGIGELGIVGAPAAVANAIYHATGKRLRRLPITPDQLLEKRRSLASQDGSTLQGLRPDCEDESSGFLVRQAPECPKSLIP